jgi:transcriptional regulator with PAS, ATPase and Fis domain
MAVNRLATHPAGNVDPADAPIAVSPQIRELLRFAQRAAAGDAKVLITGESGAGKDVVARFIHAHSQRSRAEYVPVNCAGVTESLLESELFGHRKGSFTGAYRDKIGKLQLAHRGTLFLDEVGEMSLRMQAVLLRFLENGEIHAIGDDAARNAVDVRVIAATNRNLKELVRAGQFREDLLYRLQVIHLCVPPLRDRREDIRPLALHFLQRSRYDFTLTDEAWQALELYRWPGNVRELHNALERAAIVCEGGLINADHLSLAGPRLPLRLASRGDDDVPTASAHTAADLKAVERGMVEKALSEARFNKSDAARALGLSRKQLYGRLRRFGLE